MAKLINSINILKKSKLKETIDKKIKEFCQSGKKQINEIFKELCLCIMTANFQAEKSIFIQKEIGDGFLKLPQKKLAERLKKLGHRFPNTRAKYIVEARQHIAELTKLLSSNSTEKEKREWIAKNIKGIGYKETSHFLRNIGYNNFAIIDFHIIDILDEHGLIKKPKTKALTMKKYFEIEKVLHKLAKEVDLNLAELDLYLWYMETGKVLK